MSFPSASQAVAHVGSFPSRTTEIRNRAMRTDALTMLNVLRLQHRMEVRIPTKQPIRVEYSAHFAPIVGRSPEWATLGDILVGYGDLGLDGRGGPASTVGAGT